MFVDFLGVQAHSCPPRKLGNILVVAGARSQCERVIQKCRISAASGKPESTDRRIPYPAHSPPLSNHPYPHPQQSDDHLRPTRSFPRRLRSFLQNPLPLAQTGLALVRELGRVQKNGVEIRRLAYVFSFSTSAPLVVFVFRKLGC